MEPIQDKKDIFKGLNKIYDWWVKNQFIASFYQGSNYMNWGYWNERTLNIKDACDNQVDTLVGFIPKKNGNILEVACGAGGVTKRLFNFYSPPSITAINISDFQLRKAADYAPGCTFLLMDATELSFTDNSFNNIISVEAAFHFNTREKFLKEAYRVLKRDGKLVMSDILFSPSSFSKITGKGSLSHHRSGKNNAISSRNNNATSKDSTAFGRSLGNHFNSLEEYKQLFIDAGFRSEDIVVEDVTKATWPKYISAMKKSISGFSKGSITKRVWCHIYWLYFFVYFEYIQPVDKYVLVSAGK